MMYKRFKDKIGEIKQNLVNVLKVINMHIKYLRNFNIIFLFCVGF